MSKCHEKLGMSDVIARLKQNIACGSASIYDGIFEQFEAEDAEEEKKMHTESREVKKRVTKRKEVKEVKEARIISFVFTETKMSRFKVSMLVDSCKEIFFLDSNMCQYNDLTHEVRYLGHEDGSKFRVLADIDSMEYRMLPKNVISAVRRAILFRYVMGLKSQYATEIVVGNGRVYTLSESETTFGNSYRSGRQIPDTLTKFLSGECIESQKKEFLRIYSIINRITDTNVALFDIHRRIRLRILMFHPQSLTTEDCIMENLTPR